jgi:hypothetical protein
MGYAVDNAPQGQTQTARVLAASWHGTRQVLAAYLVNDYHKTSIPRNLAWKPSYLSNMLNKGCLLRRELRG